MLGQSRKSGKSSSVTPFVDGSTAVEESCGLMSTSTFSSGPDGPSTMPFGSAVNITRWIVGGALTARRSPSRGGACTNAST